MIFGVQAPICQNFSCCVPLAAVGSSLEQLVLNIRFSFGKNVFMNAIRRVSLQIQYGWHLLLAGSVIWLYSGNANAQEQPAVFRLPQIVEEPIKQMVTPVSGEEVLPTPSFAPPPSGYDLPMLPDSSNGIDPGDANLHDPVLVDPTGSEGWFSSSSWFDKGAWDPWEGNLEFGLNGTDGNTETFNVRVGATAKHKTDWLEKTLQITTIQKTANGATTASTSLIDGRLDWPMKNSRWNYFIHGLIEYDEFKTFDYRVSADTGFGYEFIQSETITLIGRAGLAGSQEFGGPEDGFNPELLFGGEWKHQINDSNKVLLKVDYYPNIGDFADFRLNSQASWEVTLAKEWGLSMKWSLIDRYDSTPHGAKRNDLDYSTLLIWAF
jgi:putative salt-induced outer membrane protein YdiY